MPRTSRNRLTDSQRLDLQIQHIFTMHCNGLQIPILRISEIFNAGRKAIAAGGDWNALESAVIDTTRRIAAETAGR